MSRFFDCKQLRIFSFTGRSLPAQLAIFLGVVLPLLWLSTVVYLQHVHHRVVEEVQKENANLVRVFAEEVQSSVHAIDLTLIDLRERWLEEPRHFASKVRMRQAYLQKDVAFQVAIIDARGMLVYSSTDPNTRAINLSDREHFRVHIDSAADSLFTSKPVLGRVSKRWSIQFTRRLIDTNAQFAGVIVLSVAPEYFTRFSQKINVGESGSVTLIGASGHVLARWPEPEQGLGKTLSDLPILSDLNTVSTDRVSQSDGKYRQYTWRAVPKYHLIVAIGREMDDLLKPYFRLRMILLSAAAFTSTLLALIGYMLLTGLRHRAKLRNALEQSEIRWKYALEGAGEGVWDWNQKTNEVFFSKRCKEMLGYAHPEIDNKLESWRALIHPEDKLRVATAIADYLAAATSTFSIEYRMLCKDNSWKWILSRGMLASKDSIGEARRMIGTHADINERKRTEEAEQSYISNYDALTGLANRGLLHDRINHAIIRGASHAPVYVLCINLDRFKFVNDTLGHAAGDVLLQLMARRLQLALRGAHTVARLAGDEFVLVLEDELDEDTVTTAVQRVMDSVAKTITIETHDFFLSCTVGISMYPSDGENPETLIKHANIAMHRAKEIGRNNFQFYTGAMNERAMDRLRLESDLRHALHRNELMLHYQPQVDVRTGRLIGMEALLRWQHPQLGLVPPDRFIRVAEETGIIVPIGIWVMRTACAQTVEWHKAGLGPLQIGVNLSGNQFYQPNFIDSVKEILEETGLDARYLDIELTEGMVMTDVDEALGIMHRLKMLGVKLSLDDFGTGYSSLSYLKRFPIDVLKIDQSFVRNLTTEPDDAAIVRSIINLAQSLQLKVLAEGVETEQQLCYLRRHRCDQIQGYYFSRPLPAHGFERLLIEDKQLPFDNAVAQRQQTLLIVDDEINVIATLVRMLRSDGYRILRAYSAAEGLELLALHDVQVVLSDQRMPGMTGTEFLSRVKSLYPETIRIMLSGYTAVESIIEATNSGAVFRFHTKPWDDDVLRGSLAEAFRYHWLMRKPLPFEIVTNSAPGSLAIHGV